MVDLENTTINKGKELAKNTFIISLGRASTQLIGFLLLPLYTSLLSKEEYGIVDLVNVYSQLLLPLVILQIDQALMRYMVKERKSVNRLRGIVSSVYFFYFFQVLAFTLLFICIQSLLNRNIFVFLYLNVIVMGSSSLVLQTARGFGDNWTYSIASFLCGASTILLNVVFIAGLGLGAEGMIFASIIGNLVASVFVFIKDRVFKYVTVSAFDYNELKKAIRYAWPLIPNAIIWWIVNASDRSIVLLFLGTEANGILALSHKFPTIIIALYNLFHISWTESAMIHFSEKDKEEFFSNVFNSIFRILVFLCVLLIGCLPFVFGVLVNAKFGEAYFQIPIYTIAALLNAVAGLYSVVYIFEMKTGEIAKSSLISGAVNVLVNFVLIKKIGLYAASISSVAAFGVMALYRGIDVKRYMKLTFNKFLIYSAVLILGLGVGSYYFNNRYVSIIYLLFAVAYGFLINKNNMHLVISLMKNR